MTELQQFLRGIILITMGIRVFSQPNLTDFQQFHKEIMQNSSVDNLQLYQQQLALLLEKVALEISLMQNSSLSDTILSNQTDLTPNCTADDNRNFTTSDYNTQSTTEFITTDNHTIEKRDANSTTTEETAQTTTESNNKEVRLKPLISTHFEELIAVGLNETDSVESQNASDPNLIIAQVFPEILTTEDAKIVTSAPKLEKTLKIPTDQLKLLEEIRGNFNSTQCLQLTQDELVRELKDRGTFNPDFMAWDVRGVLHFLEKMSGKYEVEPKKDGKDMTLARNVEALENLLKELNLQGCNTNSPEFVTKLYNFTREITDSSKRYGRLRSRRDSEVLSSQSRLKYLYQLYSKPSRDDSSQISHEHHDSNSPDMIGTVHYVPFGCKKRGSGEDGYLRMCGSCQAIRRMPDNFFPPFINEVACDEDKACLYFYDYPHGKCKQKHMSFVVLKNVGTVDCQIWRKYNINIRVCCECFVDENSFFAKYV